MGRVGIGELQGQLLLQHLAAQWETTEQAQVTAWSLMDVRVSYILEYFHHSCLESKQS